jgi:hypothetical protein
MLGEEALGKVCPRVYRGVISRDLYYRSGRRDAPWSVWIESLPPAGTPIARAGILAENLKRPWGPGKSLAWCLTGNRFH